MVPGRADPYRYCLGGVAERSNAAVLKTAEVARLPWVRIPPPPHDFAYTKLSPEGPLQQIYRRGHSEDSLDDDVTLD
jgi:hypothetical protein